MDKKKFIKFFIIGAVVGIFALILYSFIAGGKKEIGTNPPAGQPTPTDKNKPLSLLRPTLRADQIIEDPSAKTIELPRAGVRVNNFYKRIVVRTNPEGDTIVVDDSGYQIIFMPKSEQFLISILGSPFEKVRKEAEEELLHILGIGRADACRLDVKITTPRFANPAQAGKNFGLSFCE
jgi:hypothetical protein